MHILQHQNMLKEATSETLDAVVKQMREEAPDAFHVETGEKETLSKRRFLNQPARPLPMAGSVRL